MCGIFGSITKKGITLSYPERKIRNQIIKGLAVGMQDRGEQGAGIAGVFPEVTDVVKKAISAEELVDSKAFNDLLKKNPQIILGHTRWATIGAISDRNTHPFDYENIIGCHNGHVDNYQNIFEENKIDGEVDSEAIFYLLNKYNNNYKRAFHELYGSFAITWIDLKTPNKLYMARDGNPLFIVKVNELQTFFWSSTELALRIAIAPFYSLKGKEVWELKPEQTYEISTNFQIKKTPISFMSYFEKSAMEKTKETKKKDADEEDEEQKDINALVIKKADRAILLPSFFERTGYINPFLKTKEDSELLISEHSRLMNLKIPEMQMIINKLNTEKCCACNKSIDFDNFGGTFWYQKDHDLLCPTCKNYFEIKFSDVIWLTKQAVKDIEIEVELWREEVFYNHCYE